MVLASLNVYLLNIEEKTHVYLKVTNGEKNMYVTIIVSVLFIVQNPCLVKQLIIPILYKGKYLFRYGISVF